MAEVGASILAQSLDTALKYVGAKIKRQLIYLFCFTSNIAGLEGEAKLLDDAIQGVQNQVDHEVTNNARDIHRVVTSWFQSSDELISEKNRIINEVPNVRGSCLKLAARFSLSRRAKKASEAMTQLREKSKQVEISQPPSAAAIKEIPIGETFSFNSRKEIELDIMNALKDKKENMIAIHGMGGLGKTTMAIKIMNTLLNEKVFDEIVIAVVSQKVDELKIQLDIGGSIGLIDLKDEYAPQSRARKLHDRLSASTRRTLLLLDDVWEELKLENLGIPRDSKGCTILITSRNSDALREMGVDKIFEMEKLSEKDAWLMFSEKAGTCVDDKNLRFMAEEVAKECGGLPIALHVLGASLHDEKSKGVWKDTLTMLRMPNPENTTHCIEKAYMPLIVSYEKLDEKVKSTFLLCCLFPEDVNISLDQMTYFCMGLGLFKDLASLEDAKGKISLVVKMLKDRSLLLDGYDEYHVRIHDVVRDVCIFIAKEEGYIGGLDCSWISHIQRPTGIEAALGFPKLRLFFSNDKEFNIDMFFEGMRELYVLSIEMYSWKSLPHTQSLNKLRTLVLDRCGDLETISVVGDLVHLEVLICRWSRKIIELPQNMRRLKHLKLLELTECRNLQSIGRGIISSLVELEELKMLGSFDRWDAIGLSELQQLTKLTCLEIQINDPLLVAQKINLSSKIERFDIRFGYDREIFVRFPEASIKNMVLRWAEETCLGYWVQKLLKEAESVCLTGKWAKKLDFPNYFPNVQSLVLQEFDIKSIETASMENNDDVATMFPQMDNLKLYNLPHLEGICKDPISFQNLKHVNLYKLPVLKQLWKSNAMSLPQLTDIYIRECEMMEYLFVWSEEDEGIISVGSSNHDATKTQRQSVTFPLLQLILIHGCPKMRSIIPGDHSSYLFCQSQRVSFGRLKSLRIQWNPFCHHNNIDTSFFTQLEDLCISKCDGSMSLCMLSVAINLGNLKQLRIDDCDEMVTVIEDDKEEGEMAVSTGGGRNRRPFPNLQELWLTRLGKLVSFSNLKNDVDLPSLKEVLISGCPNLSNISLATHTLEITETNHCNLFKVPFSKNENRIFSFVNGLQKLSIKKYHGSASIFSWSIVEHLVNLTELHIHDCEKMKKVIEGGEKNATLSFSKLRILGLSHLRNLEMFCESGVEMPLLERLWINNCQNITELSSGLISSISFQNLKQLRLYHLPALKQLWKSNTAMSLPRLTDISIEKCEMMEYMFVWSEEDENISNQVTKTQGQGVALPLPQNIFITDCPKMRSIVPPPLNGYGDHSSHLFCQQQKTLDENQLKDVYHCETAKEIWDFLADLCRESDQIKRNKLQICVEKYESFSMAQGESIAELELRFNSVVSEMASLGRRYDVADLNSKILARLTPEWEMKVVVLKERDLSTLTPREIFASLKSHEFDLQRKKVTPTTSPSTKFEDAALFAKRDYYNKPRKLKEKSSTSSTEKASDLNVTEIEEQIRKLNKQLEKLKNPAPSSSEAEKKKESTPYERKLDRRCYTCGAPDHIRMDCPKIPEWQREKIKKSFRKRVGRAQAHAMLTQTEMPNEAFDDDNFASDSEEDEGYEGEGEQALLVMMARIEEIESDTELKSLDDKAEKSEAETESEEWMSAKSHDSEAENEEENQSPKIPVDAESEGTKEYDSEYVAEKEAENWELDFNSDNEETSYVDTHRMTQEEIDKEYRAEERANVDYNDYNPATYKDEAVFRSAFKRKTRSFDDEDIEDFELKCNLSSPVPEPQRAPESEIDVDANKGEKKVTSSQRLKSSRRLGMRRCKPREIIWSPDYETDDNISEDEAEMIRRMRTEFLFGEFMDEKPTSAGATEAGKSSKQADEYAPNAHTEETYECERALMARDNEVTETEPSLHASCSSIYVHDSETDDDRDVHVRLKLITDLQSDLRNRNDTLELELMLLRDHNDQISILLDASETDLASAKDEIEVLKAEVMKLKLGKEKAEKALESSKVELKCMSTDFENLSADYVKLEEYANMVYKENVEDKMLLQSLNKSTRTLDALTDTSRKITKASNGLGFSQPSHHMHKTVFVSPSNERNKGKEKVEPQLAPKSTEIRNSVYTENLKSQKGAKLNFSQTKSKGKAPMPYMPKQAPKAAKGQSMPQFRADQKATSSSQSMSRNSVGHPSKLKANGKQKLTSQECETCLCKFSARQRQNSTHSSSSNGRSQSSHTKGSPRRFNSPKKHNAYYYTRRRRSQAENTSVEGTPKMAPRIVMKWVPKTTADQGGPVLGRGPKA